MVLNWTKIENPEGLTSRFALWKSVCVCACMCGYVCIYGYNIYIYTCVTYMMDMNVYDVYDVYHVYHVIMVIMYNAYILYIILYIIFTPIAA